MDDLGSEHHSVLDNSGFCTALIDAFAAALLSVSRLLEPTAAKVQFEIDPVNAGMGKFAASPKTCCCIREHVLELSALALAAPAKVRLVPHSRH